jgi:predicted permease
VHIRHAARVIARSPLFAATAVLSLAVGLGANVAIFTVANAFLLAPTQGIGDPGRLIDIGRSNNGAGFDTVSFSVYRDLQAAGPIFDGVFALRLEPQPVSLGAEAGAERIYSGQVSAGYFEVLGVRPAAGVFFRSGEEAPGVPMRKAVLSHAFWRARFGARPDVIGQPLTLNGDVFTIAGVGPEGFHGSTVFAPDVWVPLTSLARGMPSEALLGGRENAWLMMGARLKPGVTVDQAQAYLDTFGSHLQSAYPEIYRTTEFTAAPISRVPGVGREYVAPFLGILMGIVGLVLLVTCLNLSGLLLARAAERSREVAVRLALGATRRSLASLLLTEAALLFGAGAVAALVVAVGLTRVLQASLVGLPVPVAVNFAVDGRVLLFTIGVAALACVFTALAPSWQSGRTSLSSALKSDASAPRRQRLRKIFVAAQLAFCLVLVVTAGLFVRALTAASNVPPGFDVDPIEVANLDLALGGYPMDQAPAVVEALRERLAAIPGVERVGLARMVPLEGGGLGLGELRPQGAAGPDSDIRTDWNAISPDFLPALGIPIVAGRAFTGADRQGAPGVAIVNERFAAHVWPEQDPIGRVLEFGDFRPGREDSVATLTVVGIARDSKYRWIGEPPAPFIYVPFAQQPLREVNFFLRRAGSSSASTSLLPAVRDVLRQYNPELPLVRMQPLRQSADLGLLPQRIASSTAGTLGALALLLSAMGIYGVTAFTVASRTKEIGVRMALGADRGRVLRMVLWQGARLAGIGAVIGLVLSLGVTHLTASLLFGVSPLDPLTYAATLALLGLVTLAATLVPARRAATTDPLQALRSDG